MQNFSFFSLLFFLFLAFNRCSASFLCDYLQLSTIDQLELTFTLQKELINSFKKECIELDVQYKSTHNSTETVLTDTIMQTFIQQMQKNFDIIFHKKEDATKEMRKNIQPTTISLLRLPPNIKPLYDGAEKLQSTDVVLDIFSTMKKVYLELFPLIIGLQKQLIGGRNQNEKIFDVLSNEEVYYGLTECIRRFEYQNEKVPENISELKKCKKKYAYMLNVVSYKKNFSYITCIALFGFVLCLISISNQKYLIELGGEGFALKLFLGSLFAFILPALLTPLLLFFGDEYQLDIGFRNKHLSNMFFGLLGSELIETIIVNYF
jgi:hypothetical protein